MIKEITDLSVIYWGENDSYWWTKRTMGIKHATKQILKEDGRNNQCSDSIIFIKNAVLKQIKTQYI